MPLDIGRVTHLTDQMHRSEDDAGAPIDDGFLLGADGARGHTWVDSATLGTVLMPTGILHNIEALGDIPLGLPEL